MKLIAGTGTGINPDTGASVALTPPTIVNGFNNYSLIPSTYTLVASRSSATDLSSNTDVTGSYFTTTYDIYASSYQPAGTYSGKVKYLILHPQSNINTITGIDAAFAIAGKQKQANVVDPITGQTGNFYRMQDMTTDICNSVSQNGEVTSTQLVDIRDNKLYWVTKLKDGHCWMTQNLDLDFAQTTYTDSQGQQITTIKPLTSNDTDLTDHSLSGAYVDGYTYDDETGINTWVPATSAKTINFEGATLSGWNASYVTPYSASKTDDNGMGHSSLGNYYSWSAIIASNNSSSLTGGNANNSICPKNWRLPTVSSQPASDIGSTNEFARLNYLYNDNSAVSDANLIISPLWFVRGGQIEGNNLTAASYGKYWSSTVNGDFFASLLSFGIGNVSPSQVYDRYRSTGRTIRCLAR